MSFDFTDHGLVLDRNGAGTGPTLLDGTYREGKDVSLGATTVCTVWVVVTAANPTNLTSVEVKLQTSYDGVSWDDLGTIRLTGTFPAAVDQSIPAVAGASVCRAFGTTNQTLFNHTRSLAKATAGGALVAADRVQVFLKAA